jgi:hypothetical protein
MESCEKFLRSIEDTKWVVKNLDSLVKKYNGEFIAVLECEIVAHHKNIDDLMDIIETEFPDEIEFITTEFITSKEIKVIL